MLLRLYLHIQMFLYCNPLLEGILEGFGGALLHIQEHVRVGVERYGYGGMAEHLEDYLGNYSRYCDFIQHHNNY